MTEEDQEPDPELEQLIERAGKGDQDAVGALYELYQRRMVAVAHHRLGQTLHSLTESVDLVQSVWTDLLDDLDDFEYRGPDSFYSWLRACLINKIQSKHRYHAAGRRDAKKATPIADDGWLPGKPTDPTPSKVVMEQDEVERLMTILERFPEAQREVLVLRLRDDLPFAEIGVQLERSTEAVKKLYQRGIEKLIGLLPDDWLD